MNIKEDVLAQKLVSKKGIFISPVFSYNNDSNSYLEMYMKRYII